MNSSMSSAYRYALCVVVLLVACQALLSCGGGGQLTTSPPSSTPSLSVTPSSATVSVAATQQFTVPAGLAVSWAVNGVPGGNSSVGTISSSGVYTAPKVADGVLGVTVTAALQSNPASTASASVALVASGPISITPSSSSVLVSGTQQFTLVNASNNAVSWTVNHVAGGNSTVGTIDAKGFYTAPAVVPTGIVDVTAISVTNPANTADATVNLLYPAPTVSSLAPAQLSQASATGIVSITVNGTGLGPATTASIALPLGSVALTTSQVTATKFELTFLPDTLLTVGTFTLSIQNPSPGGGEATASLQVTSGGPLFMTTPRADHTSTLLPSGKVLVAGGTWSMPGPPNSPALQAELNTAELYDPSTQLFSRTTMDMTAARSSHTATLLNDGTVLLAGGFGANGHEATAEIYDPSRDTFTAIGPMITARYGHTATLLNNGKVLLAGGDSSGTAELYDPSTRTFSATGHMIDNGLFAVTRIFHTATLLPDGRVLIVGGWNGAVGIDAVSLSSCEIYDPASGTFASTGSLLVERADHTATLLQNGQVLVAGGTEVHGGIPYTPYATAELYDTQSGTFLMPAIQMVVGRVFHTATLLPDGTVRLIGGSDVGSTQRGDPRTELFDPVRSAFAQSTSLSIARHSHAATLLMSGRVILITGGIRDGGSSSYINVAELVQ